MLGMAMKIGKIKFVFKLTTALLLGGLMVSTAQAKPHQAKSDLVDLKVFDASILIDMRLATADNLLGRPVNGYKQGKCLLHRDTAERLSAVQKELLAVGYSLKVYDCQRNQDAIDDLIAFSKSEDKGNQSVYFPQWEKAKLIAMEFIKPSKLYLNGRAVDVTIVPKSHQKQAKAKVKASLACQEYKNRRFLDNSVNMGSGFHCFAKPKSDSAQNISLAAFENRLILRQLMEKHDFKADDQLWWHFETIG